MPQIWSFALFCLGTKDSEYYSKLGVYTMT
jgi:hypothetical protein